MRRYIQRNPKPSLAEREQALAEKLRQEMRELTLREVRGALSSALKEFEREMELYTEAAEKQLGTLIFRAPNSPDSEGSSSRTPTYALGATLGKTVVRLFSQQRRSRVTTSSNARESDRSTQENRFYRESRSQRESNLSAISSGGARNL